MSVNFPQTMMKISTFPANGIANTAACIVPKIIIIMYEKHLNNKIKIE
jgi:hypothetical protein